MSFDDLQRFGRGFYRIDFKEFDHVLSETIGASTAYSRGCWKEFRDNPVGYMLSRNPIEQGEKLFTLAWEKGERR